MNTRNSPIRRRVLLGTLALVAVGSCPQKALAQTFNWNVNGGGSWITDTNWNPVAVGDWPKDAGDVANLTFNLTNAAPIALNAPITLGALTIGDTDATHSYTLSDGTGGSLTFDNSGLAATLTQSVTGLSDTISATLRTAGDLSIVNANTTAGRVFTLSGPLTSSAASGTQTVTFSQANANAAVLMSGSITNGLTGGTIAVNKTGSGTLTFGAVNGYTGGTTLSAGTIIGNAANSITGTYTQNGGTLRINNYALAATADAATGAIVNASAGTFTMNSNAVAGNAVSVSLGALNVSGNYAIRADNNGTALAAGTVFTLNAPLTISGAPTITSTSGTNATVTIGGLTTLNSDVTIAGTTIFRFTTLTEDATPRKITRTGTGLLNMQGVANYSGGTDVLSGTVQFGVTGASGSGLIQIGDTAGTAAAEIRLFPGTTVANDITVRSGSSGTAKIARDTGGTAGTGTLSGTITLQKNTIFENASSGTAGTATLDVTGRVTGADVKITVTRGGSANSQFVRFSNAANDFGFAVPTDDAITVGNGVFLFTSDAALGAAGNNITLTGAGSSLRAEGTFSTARKLTFNAVGAAVDAAAGSELTLSANGQIAGTAPFRKGTATGTVVITGDNSARTLETIVAGGTLRISSAANIGTGSPVTLAGGTLSLVNDAATTLGNPITVTSSSGLNADRATGGAGDGLTHTFGTIAISGTTTTLTFSNGNNYGITTGAVTSTATTATILTNNLSGTGVLTIPSITQTTAGASGVTLGGTGATVVTGNITQGGTGAVALTKTGAGTATLLGTGNSFGGNIAVSGGTLRATHASSLGGGTGIVTIANSGSTLELRSDTPLTFANNVSMNNTGTVLHVDQAIGGSGTGLTHTIGNLSVGGTSTPIISGGNGYGLNAGVLSFVDSAGLTNNAPGPVTFASATVNSPNGETVTFRGTGSTVITGGISQTGAGTFSLLKLDTGSLAINGASSITGNINIGNTTTAGGTVTMSAAGALPNATALSVLSGTLNMNGFNLSPLSVVLGDGPAGTSANILTGAGTLTLLGNLTYNTEAGHLGGFIVGNVALGGATRTFTVADTTSTDPDLTIDGPITDATGSLIKAGTGQMRLLGTTANTYVGATQVAGGTLQLGKTAGVNAVPGDVNLTPTTGHSLLKNLASNQIPNTAIITMTGVAAIGGGHWDLNGFDETVGGLVWNNNQAAGSEAISTGAGTLTLNGNITVAGTSTATTASPPLPALTGNVIDGNLNLGGTVRTIDVTATGNALISAAITNGSIIKTGATTLILAGANTFGIDTDVQAGTLELRHVAAAGGRNVTLNGGNFSLKHNGDGTTNPETINFAGNVTLTGANATLIADRIGGTGSTKTLTIPSLTMAGETVTVTANNGYTFGVLAPLSLTASPIFNVTAGTFALGGGAGDAGSGFGITKQGAGTIAFNAASTFQSLTVTGGNVAGTGTITLRDDFAPLTLRNNTISANLALTGADGAAITFDPTSNGTGTISGALDLGAGLRSFNIAEGSGTPDLNITGVLSGSGGWTKDGFGNLRLGGTAPNTYSGPVTVNSGTLSLNKTAGVAALTGNLTQTGGFVAYLANDQIADTASVTIDGGEFRFHNGGVTNFSETLANITLNNGLLRTASGTVPTASLVTVTGTLTIAGGDFALNSGSHLTANKIIVNGGANVIGGNTALHVTQFTVGAGGIEFTGGQMKMNIGTVAGAQGSQVVLGGNVSSFASPFEAGFFGESAPGSLGTRTVAIGAGSRTFTIEEGDAINDFRIDFDITGSGTLVKEGDGTLALNGLIGTGTTSVTANDGIIAIAQSQTLAALTIGAGGTVVLVEDLLPSPAAALTLASSQTLAPLHIGDGATVVLDDSGAPLAVAAPSGLEDAAQVAAVPEPGALGLLAAGVLGLFSRSRRRARQCAGTVAGR